MLGLRPSQVVAALLAAGSAALSLGTLPHPWADVVTVVVAALAAVYIPSSTTTRCPSCGTAHTLMVPPVDCRQATRGDTPL